MNRCTIMEYKTIKSDLDSFLEKKSRYRDVEITPGSTTIALLLRTLQFPGSYLVRCCSAYFFHCLCSISAPATSTCYDGVAILCYG